METRVAADARTILAPIRESYPSVYRNLQSQILTSKGEGTGKMPGIRILVVDDSVVIRKVLCEVLASDQAIEVAGSAAGGSIALAKIPQLKPDLITLDVEMPAMSGLETLAEIRTIYPRLPVIMFSTLTERGVPITSVPKIKALCQRKATGTLATSTEA